MKIDYQRPLAEPGVFIPGSGLLEQSSNMSGDIADLEVVEDSWT